MLAFEMSMVCLDEIWHSSPQCSLVHQHRNHCPCRRNNGMYVTPERYKIFMDFTHYIDGTCVYDSFDFHALKDLLNFNTH